MSREIKMLNVTAVQRDLLEVAAEYEAREEYNVEYSANCASSDLNNDCFHSDFCIPVALSYFTSIGLIRETNEIAIRDDRVYQQ